jgi:hypothetical protein
LHPARTARDARNRAMCGIVLIVTAFIHSVKWRVTGIYFIMGVNVD